MTSDKIEFEILNNAYDNYLFIKQCKFHDVKKLINHVIILSNCIFYDSLKCSNIVENISNSILRAHNLLSGR